jgi:hypothetical protein
LDLMVLSKGILNTGAIILINSWEEEITLQWPEVAHQVIELTTIICRLLSPESRTAQSQILGLFDIHLCDSGG